MPERKLKLVPSIKESGERKTVEPIRDVDITEVMTVPPQFDEEHKIEEAQKVDEDQKKRLPSFSKRINDERFASEDLVLETPQEFLEDEPKRAATRAEKMRQTLDRLPPLPDDEKVITAEQRKAWAQHLLQLYQQQMYKVGVFSDQKNWFHKKIDEVKRALGQKQAKESVDKSGDFASVSIDQAEKVLEQRKPSADKRGKFTAVNEELIGLSIPEYEKLIQQYFSQLEESDHAHYKAYEKAKELGKLYQIAHDVNKPLSDQQMRALTAYTKEQEPLEIDPLPELNTAEDSGIREKPEPANEAEQKRLKEVYQESGLSSVLGSQLFEMEESFQGNERFTLAEGIKRKAIFVGDEVLKLASYADRLQNALTRAKFILMELPGSSVIESLNVDRLSEPEIALTPQIRTWVESLDFDKKIEVYDLFERMTDYRKKLVQLANKYKRERARYARLKVLAETIEDPHAHITEKLKKILLRDAPDLIQYYGDVEEKEFEQMISNPLTTMKEQVKMYDKKQQRVEDAKNIVSTLRSGQLPPLELMTDQEILEGDVEDVDEQVA